MPLIGIGGINSGAAAIAKIEAGATLLQLYTGLVFEGPGLHRPHQARPGRSTSTTGSSPASPTPPAAAPPNGPPAPSTNNPLPAATIIPTNRSAERASTNAFACVLGAGLRRHDV